MEYIINAGPGAWIGLLILVLGAAYYLWKAIKVVGGMALLVITAPLFLCFAIMSMLPYIYASAGLLMLYRYPFSTAAVLAGAAGMSYYLLNKRKVPVKVALRSFWSLIKAVFSIDRSLKNRRRGRLAAVLVLLNVLLFTGAGMLLAGTVGGLDAELMTAGFVMSALGLFYFKLLKEGNIMIDVFDLVDDRSKLEEFFAAEKHNAAVTLNPEQVIPAIKREVIGQDFVVEDVVRTLYRRTQLKRKGKPLGVFMFVGATGSGKTELAKAIAKHVFEGRLARFDMNEFTHESSAQRLIGAPPGYIGAEQGGQLTQAIKRMGSGVILFDEIEKADPAVYKMIMGLMDEGRITEQSTGETMNAQNFVIIMTSNAAHRELAEIAARISDPEERRRAVKDTLLQVFRPEQLARVDEIFCFNKLDRRAVAQIVAKFVYQFAHDAGVTLDKIDADLVIDIVLKHERMSDYGIRELIRLVEKSILDGMLEVRNAGKKRVRVTVSGDRVVVLPA